MKTPLFFVVLALSLAASARAQTQPWLEGQHSGVKVTLAVAVQNDQQWNKIWHEHDASTPAPSVDFSKESVVAVFLGETETAGVKVAVTVQKDPLVAGRLNVFYRTVVSKKGFSAQVETQPYAIVKVPRAAAIDVERDGVVSMPERTDPPAAPAYDPTKVHALLQDAQNPSFDGN